MVVVGVVMTRLPVGGEHGHHGGRRRSGRHHVMVLALQGGVEGGRHGDHGGDGEDTEGVADNTNNVFTAPVVSRGLRPHTYNPQPP